MMNTRGIVISNGQSEILAAQSRDPSFAPLQPEKRLMLAVLEYAVNDFQTYAMVPTRRGKQLFTEVAAWFSSSASGPFDFHGICEATGLDPDYIRKGLLDWYGSPRPRPDPRTVARAPKTAASLPLWVRAPPPSMWARLDAWVECMTVAARRIGSSAASRPRTGVGTPPPAIAPDDEAMAGVDFFGRPCQSLGSFILRMIPT